MSQWSVIVRLFSKDIWLEFNKKIEYACSTQAQVKYL